MAVAAQVHFGMNDWEATVEEVDQSYVEEEGPSIAKVLIETNSEQNEHASTYHDWERFLKKINLN